MTKSRIALHVVAASLFWPSGAALAQSAPAPLSAEELIAAHNARILDAMGRIDGVARCPRGGPGDDAIVVCGRDNSARMRALLQSPSEPGTRQRLVAGEAPSAVGALNVGRACCGNGGGINVIGVAGALARGFGRIFHPG